MELEGGEVRHAAAQKNYKAIPIRKDKAINKDEVFGREHQSEKPCTNRYKQKAQRKTPVPISLSQARFNKVETMILLVCTWKR